MEDSFYTQFHTASEMVTIFDNVFGSRLGFCGYQSIGPRKWVKETGLGFKRYFYLSPVQSGAAYLPCGAISLDFVPRIKAGRIRLQPQPKHVAPHHFFGDGKTRWSWMIGKHREGFGDRLETIAGESVTQITDWFDQFKSVSDVVVAIDQEKVKSIGSEFYHYPISVLAYSFGLARVRRTADAKTEFERIINSSFFDPDIRPQLREVFEAEVGESRN